MFSSAAGGPDDPSSWKQSRSPARARTHTHTNTHTHIHYCALLGRVREANLEHNVRSLVFYLKLHSRARAAMTTDGNGAREI